MQTRGATYVVKDASLFHAGIPNTDVDVGYDGKIYLADFGGGWVRSDKGNIYTLFDPQTIERPIVSETERLFRQGFDRRSASELCTLLSHPDMRVRLRSQFTLAARGSDSIESLKRVAVSAAEPLARYHAIWGLGQLEAVPELVPLLKDKESEVRVQAVRALGNIKSLQTAAAIRTLIDDDNPRVSMHAAMASGKLGDADAMPLVVEMLERNADRDAFQRHAGVFALQRIANAGELRDLKSHDADAVRLAAVLALRRMRVAGIVDFLNDPEPRIVHESIRAINDENISDALPGLADYVATIANSHAVPDDELIFRRIINVCLRVGRVKDAITLLQLARKESLAPAQRVLALRTLELFDSPPPIDATVGLYRPLPTREQAPYRKAIASELIDLFENSTGDLAASSIRVMSHYGIRLDEESLVNRIRDGRQPEAVRHAALEQLVAEQRYDQKLLLKSLLVDESAVIRSAAARSYVMAFPDEALSVIDNLIEQATDSDLRTAYDIMAIGQSEDLAQRNVRATHKTDPR